MRILIRALEYAVTALMGTVAVLVITEVALRNLASTSLIITDELSRYLMVWTAMLTATLLVYEDGHIRLTFLTDALPPVVARAVYFVSELMVLCFLALLTVSSLMLLPSIRQQNTVTLGVSMVWFYAALPVTGTLMFVLTVRAMVRRFRALAPPADPASRT
jgi:TRAP-type C4-dicarboxylate transport system permease small subunit